MVTDFGLVLDHHVTHHMTHPMALRLPLQAEIYNLPLKQLCFGHHNALSMEK